MSDLHTSPQPKPHGIVGIFSSAEQADRLLRQRSGAWRPSLLTKRRTIRKMLDRKDSAISQKNTRNRANLIRSGRLNGLLGLTAGVGAVELPELGAVVATGSLFSRRSKICRGLIEFLKKIGLPSGAANQIMDVLRNSGVLVAVQIDPEKEGSLSTLDDRFAEEGALRTWLLTDHASPSA